MDQTTHNKIVSFIWGIADDVLRDLFKCGKYPDVILPMCVIRRMDAVLRPTKQAVLDEWFRKHAYSTKDADFDLIYVNGGNNLPNVRRDDETWKVRLIEEDFHRLMFEMEGA